MAAIFDIQQHGHMTVIPVVSVLPDPGNMVVDVVFVLLHATYEG